MTKDEMKKKALAMAAATPLEAERAAAAADDLLASYPAGFRFDGRAIGWLVREINRAIVSEVKR